MGRHLFLSSVLTAAVFLQRLEGLMIGSLQPIVALAGNDIILPCHLEPTADLSDQTVEWSRPGTSVTIVHVRRDGAELLDAKDKSYVCRTELFLNELKNGNISLKLSRVTRSDEGTYKCSVPILKIQSLIELHVGVVSLPVTSIVGTKDGGVDLQCESGGWYPEPEVEWLDSKGQVFSAGPTETLKDPDNTFTFRRHVTVYQSATNRFTCRVQQQHISQTRETVIHVPDSLFPVPAWKWIVGVLGTILVIAVTAITIYLYLLKMKNDTILQKIISKTKILNTSLAALEERHIHLRYDLADRKWKYGTMKKDLRNLKEMQKNQERIKKLINLLDPGDSSKKEEIKELVSLVFKDNMKAQIVERKNKCVDLEQRIKELEEMEKNLLINKSNQMDEFKKTKAELSSRLHGCFAKRNQAIVEQRLAKLEKRELHNSETKKEALKGLEKEALKGLGERLWRPRSSEEELWQMSLSDEEPFDAAEELRRKILREERRMKIKRLHQRMKIKPEDLRMRIYIDEESKEAADMSSDARPGVPAMSVDGRGVRRPQDEELKEAAEVC